jgi:hypothetical protein
VHALAPARVLVYVVCAKAFCLGASSCACLCCVRYGILFGYQLFRRRQRALFVPSTLSFHAILDGSLGLHAHIKSASILERPVFCDSYVV